MRNSSREPVALTALKFPYLAGMFILSTYNKIVFAPFHLLWLATKPFLYCSQFEQGVAKFYLQFWLLRGFLALLLLALWLAATLSPAGLFLLADKYLLPNLSDKESLWLTGLGTAVLSSVVAAKRVIDDKEEKSTVKVLKLCQYLVEDLVSTILTVITVLLVFNASKVFVGDFNGPQRKYLKFISYLLLLSLLDWLTFGFRILITIYPVRKFEHNILMNEFIDDPFKQKMVTLQEGLYTARELAFLPLQLSIYFTMLFSVRLEFMRLMSKLSHMKTGERLKQIGKAFLLDLGIIIAVVLNGPFQNLTFRMLFELAKCAKDIHPDEFERVLSAQGKPISDRIQSAFAKWLVVFISSPSRIKLIARDYVKKEVAVEKNWFSYLVKNILLELNPGITTIDVLRVYGKDMRNDFLANLGLFCSLILNPVTFIQLLLQQVRWPEVFTSEELAAKNKAIFDVYPDIFFDYLILAIFIIIFILTAYQIPRNIQLYKAVFTSTLEPVLFCGKPVKHRPVFFQNIGELLGMQLALLFADIMLICSLPFLILVKEHRQANFLAWRTRWLDPELRLDFLRGCTCRFALTAYLETRVALTSDHKYQKYFRELDIDLANQLQTNLAKEVDPHDPITVYRTKLRTGLFAKRNKVLLRIFRSKRRLLFINLVKTLASAFGLGKYFQAALEFKRTQIDTLLDQPNTYETMLDREDQYVTMVRAGTKEVFLTLVFKLVSLTLLWRLPTFMLIMEKGPVTNPDPAYKKDLKLVIRLFKFCLRLMLTDILYQGLFSLILLTSPSDNTYVKHKWQSLVVDGNLLTEESLRQQFDAYFAVKKEYVGYVVDDLLSYFTTALGYIFYYRHEMFTKIKLLVTLPQLENMNARNVNSLILSIAVKDLVSILAALVVLPLDPCRLYSFALYVKEGYFNTDINTQVKYSKFESATLISSSLDNKRAELLGKVYKGFVTDLIVFGGCLLAIINPTKIFFFLTLYERLRMKFQLKQKRQGREFFDEAFARQLIDDVKDMLRESKEDLLSLLAMTIIFFGVYEVKETYNRVSKLLVYRWKQSKIYRWWTKPKHEPKASSQANEVVLHRLNWMCFVDLSDYLTMQDKLNMTMLNKKSRHYFMNTPFIWINYYRDVVNPTVITIEDVSPIPAECINHYRRELAEKNNKELDFKLGIRYILKEEAIRSVISLPQLISSPYHGLFKLRDFLSGRNYNVGDVAQLLARYNQDAQVEHTAYEAGGEIVDQPIVYKVRFRHAMNPLTTDMVPDDFKTRMKGFELLEYSFYKVVFFLVDKALTIYGIFIHTYDYNPVGFVSFAVSMMYALLQIVFCALVVVFIWYYIKFYYTVIGLDFVHSLAGPLGIHILIGISFATMAMHPYYGRRRFSPWGIFLVLKNVTFAVAVRVTKPLYEGLSKVFKYILYNLSSAISGFFKSVVNLIKIAFKAVFFVYKLPVMLVSKALLGKGVLLEYVHLAVIVVWVIAPAYYGWKLGGIRNILISVILSLVQGVLSSIIIKETVR